MQFTWDGNRSDLQGAKKLDAVKLYERTTAGLSYTMESDLYYSYFAPSYYHTWAADTLLLSLHTDAGDMPAILATALTPWPDANAILAFSILAGASGGRPNRTFVLRATA